MAREKKMKPKKEKREKGKSKPNKANGPNGPARKSRKEATVTKEKQRNASIPRPKLNQELVYPLKMNLSPFNYG